MKKNGVYVLFDFYYRPCTVWWAIFENLQTRAFYSTSHMGTLTCCSDNIYFFENFTLYNQVCNISNYGDYRPLIMVWPLMLRMCLVWPFDFLNLAHHMWNWLVFKTPNNFLKGDEKFLLFLFLSSSRKVFEYLGTFQE